MLKRYALICCSAGMVAAVLHTGCEEDTEDSTISQFDRPQDVALVCYDDDGDIPLPISCCKTEPTVACAQYAASANLYAFVTQTTSGEVAVVDVAAHTIVDQEPSIPYNTFIPVGGQPNDIAASEDGSRVYTANYETGDISVIRVTKSIINDPFLSAAGSINLSPPDADNLSGLVARMVLVKSPDEYKDKFALVTQPGLSRLTVVSLLPEYCPDPDASPDGCALGYVPLTASDVSKPHPWAIAASDGQSAYVGAYDAEVIWDVQIQSLVAEALALSEFGPVDSEKVLNDEIPIGYKLRSLSLEPIRQRWIYAVENGSGAVIAINLQNRIPYSDEEVTVISVSILGKTRSLALVELQEKGDPDPFTFNGTFAVAATSKAAFGVVDIEDNQPTTTFFRPHHLRSVVDLSDPDSGVPEMEDDPTLNVDGEKIDKRSVKNYLAFNDTDDVDGGCDDAGDGFRPEYDNGVRFRCNPYESRRETWSFEWEGSIDVSGVGIIVNITEPEDPKIGPWRLLNEDEFKDFCSQELYTQGSSGGYPGDRLVITSKPTPVEGKEDFCKKLYPSDKTLAYRIVGVSKYEPVDTSSEEDTLSEVPNVIEFIAEDGMPALVKECFGQAVSFEVHANNQWIVRGSRSLLKRTAGTFKPLPGDPPTGFCNYVDPDGDTDNPPEPSKMRMNVGDPFENDYLKFRLSYQGEWADGPVPLDWEEGDTDREVTAEMEFKIVNGYEEMYRNIVGTNITDIEFTPDNQIVMVDQAGEGLIVFDLLTSFNVVGGNVN